MTLAVNRTLNKNKQTKACAPRVFTKILKPIYSYLRSQGVITFYYIDDSLTKAADQVKCKVDTENLVSVIEAVGFQVNREKSVMVPVGSLLIWGISLTQ
ncbi:hypothetical protein CI610_03153 [invertebrate metagenome]|uniref:Reverse transcriptase domain-containing protein n=1 Tax=invertebrate metagenome TaxID=1711999 RepID=A0A2H9T3V4_9ZZZZ